MAGGQVTDAYFSIVKCIDGQVRLVHLVCLIRLQKDNLHTVCFFVNK
jgi:hypothetical protein